MSKKITSFLMLLVMFLFTGTAKAQLQELELKSVTVGQVVENFEPNTWYFLHQGRDAGIGTGQYAPALAGEVPTAGGFLYDNGAGNNILKPGVGNVEENTLATAVAGFLVRFIPTDNEGAYNIQFGTGRYMTGPAGSGNSQNFKSTDNIYDAGEFNLYAIDPDNAPGAIGFNVYDMGQRVDNNFSGASGINTGNTVVTWGSGAHESVLNGEGMIVSNSIWSVAEVIFESIDERDALWAELQSVYSEYYGYFETMEAGTDPGQYDPELLAAFQAALEAANIDDMDPDMQESLTADQLRAMIQAIKDTYEAVVATQVKYTMASGYYFIKNGFIENGVSKWYETITDEETQEETTIYVDKYMTSTISGTSIRGTWGSVDMDDITSKAPALWKVTATEDGAYDIQNMGTDGRFNNVVTSTAVTMDPESENLMAIDFVGRYEDTDYVDIRVSTQAANDYFYLHAGGHGSGAGKSGNLVGWSCGKSDNGFGATEWTFVPVSEEEALQIIEDYAPFRNHDKMVEEYKAMVADAKAKIEIAKDIQVSLDEETPLITDAAQLSSPYTESSEGSIEALIDGDASTFWHSAWSGGNVAGGTHYLQVEMSDVSVANAAFQYTRRAVTNDHVTEMGVYGTNEFEAEKDDCEELAVVSLPFGSNSETLTSSVFPTNGYKYLRFYGNTMYPSTRGYFHMAEFQLYPAEVIQSETCQYNVMGDIVKNLEALIEAQKDIEDADLTVDEYNALKAAYEAFIAKFVDPAALRQALADVATTAEAIEIGTDPGFWAEGSNAATLVATIDAAKAYDAAGDYTPEKSEEFINNLQTQAEGVYASAIPVQTGKWYRIRFATEDEFEKYDWDKVAGNGTENIPSLFGKYISVADFFTEEGREYIERADAEDIALGHQIYFLDKDDIQDANANLFRFVAVGDSAYILQNKATNMFLKAAGTSGAVTFSVHPTLFNVRAIGYGENVISAKSITGEYQSNLHAQVSHNVLVTWDVDYPGSRSGFYIEEAEDVAADYDGSEFNVAVVPGAVNTFCFPVEVSVKGDDNVSMWGVAKLEDTKLTLTPVKDGKAEAGRPFIIINGKTTDYDAEFADETEMIQLKHGYEVGATEPQTSGLLKGSFSGEKVGAGVIVAEGNTFVLSKKSNTSIGANSAYISTGEPFTNLEATVEVVWDETGEDGITAALQNVTRSGAAYTIDGRLVSPNATLSDLTRFGKGLYILNGTKVIVK